MTDAPEREEEEGLILDSAERLFAALGYDGTSTEMITAASGSDPDRIAELGGRGGVYLRVLDRFLHQQLAMLAEIESFYTPDRKGVRRYLDHLVDFYLDHPEGTSIWKHRRLSDAADFQDLEERFHNPVFRRSLEVLGPEVVGHPDFEMLSVISSYCIYGFVQGGLLPLDRGTPAPDSPEARRRFRSYMYRLHDLLFQDGFMRDVPEPGPG